jgi:hypothetical protein
MTTYRYTVDGEKVTMAEIKDRCPDVDRKVIQRRVSLGYRSWEKLQRVPVKGRRATKSGVRV